jgi:dTDP-4-amino-4,6-dideoxygalactose transaminase
MGKLAVCSFYGTKLLTAGHGGAVSADDECLYRKLRSLMIHDKQGEWQPHFHFMMSDFNASLALAQFAKLEWMIKRRREIACRFMNALGEQGREPDGNVYSRFIVEADGGADRLIAEFSKAGIEAKRPVFLPLYRYLGYKDTDFPNAAWAHEYIVSVPLYPALTESEIEYIESFLEKHKDEMRCWPSA